MPAARIAQIESMIAARDGQPGYKRNVMALKAELERLTQIQDWQTFTSPERESAVDTSPTVDSQDSPAA